VSTNTAVTYLPWANLIHASAWYRHSLIHLNSSRTHNIVRLRPRKKLDGLWWQPQVLRSFRCYEIACRKPLSKFYISHTSTFLHSFIVLTLFWVFSTNWLAFQFWQLPLSIFKAKPITSHLKIRPGQVKGHCRNYVLFLSGFIAFYDRSILMVRWSLTQIVNEDMVPLISAKICFMVKGLLNSLLVLLTQF